MEVFSSFPSASKLAFRIYKEVKNIKCQKNPQRIQSINVQMKLNRQFSEEVKMDNNCMTKMFNISSHQGNPNQNLLKFCLTPVRMASITSKKQ